jgi:hypothetical protein
VTDNRNSWKALNKNSNERQSFFIEKLRVRKDREMNEKRRRRRRE